MEPDPRYEIVNAIASGDFATVYRARDRELGREVAIKQIHQQFLSDPRQLERYWREAQLLASLQHPNILTIYDIVRPRGWLILELMRGNLHTIAKGEPIDLDYLRAVLICCLRALKFLHANGIVHGDVKPSNMLVDPQNRVKLGDFGLARRATGEEGSLLKGTTKYMAPELVSNQFGPRGPASDLYSLGFSAYELMCGAQFESLFPGLSTFGSDRQIAWLMWHAAADRNLPPINRVLEGVPEDLARVIQGMVVKDQTRRYQSADAVLRHLRAGAARVPPVEEKDPRTEAAAAEEARKKRLVRIGAIFAVVVSLVLSVLMLLPGKPEPTAEEKPEPTRGIVRNVYPDERTLVLERSDDGRPEEIPIKLRDEILINDKKHLFRDLQPGDRATIEYYRDEQGRRITRIVAFRPEARQGRIAAIEPDEGKITIALGAGEDQVTVRVPASVDILFNGQEQLDGKPVTLAELHVDDRVVVYDIGEETGRVATGLEVKRVVTVEGTIRDVDLSKGELTVAPAEGDPSELVVLPFAPKCKITINHRNELGGRLLKPEDLAPGDRATVSHDTHVVQVDAYRILGQAGVVEKVHYAADALEVKIEGQRKATRFLIGPKSQITLGGQPAELTDLRAGDLVDVTHDAPGSKNPEVLTIAASRPPNPSRWAILVGIQNYEDASLSTLDYPVADAKLLEQTLVGRYAVPANQVLLLADPSQVRLEQGVTGLLDRVKPDDEVILYFAGHAYRDDQGTIYLAPKNFDLSRISSSGVSLQWLVDQFEQCAAKKKLLLLDSSHSGSGADLAKEPSTAEMLQTLEAPPGRAPLRTVTAIASSSKGQRGLPWPDKQHGLFAYSVSDGFSGTADANRDGRLEATELFAYLEGSMKSAAAEIGQAQTPKLFLPDASPPRLSEKAKGSLRKLAAYLAQDRIELFEVNLEYSIAQKLAAGELEPKLLYSLLLLKARDWTEAERLLEELSIADPDLLLPLQGQAWLKFQKRTYADGVEKLAQLVTKIPAPRRPADSYSPQAQHVFEWAGRLREFAAVAVPENFRLPDSILRQLDAAIAAHPTQAAALYQQGRDHTRQILEEIDKRIETGDGAEQSRARIERRQLTRYASFPYDQARAQILAGLDK